MEPPHPGDLCARAAKCRGRMLIEPGHWLANSPIIVLRAVGHGFGQSQTESCRDDAMPPPEIEGDGEEVDVNGVAGEREGAHAAHAVATLHGAEQALDVAPHRRESMVP